MRIGLVIYGSLDTLSGGYLYDRKLVEYLRAQGDDVRVISLPWRNYASHLADNLSFRLPSGLDILIQDELNHPSLLAANAKVHPCPVVSLVHHLRCSEPRSPWQNYIYRMIEQRYLHSVDSFIFNSKTTQEVVQAMVGRDKPSVVAYPPTDRFGRELPEIVVTTRAQASRPLQLLFIGNLIPRKGLHVLLHALSQLERGKFVLEVVGSLNIDPAYSRRLKALVARLGLSSYVRFHGALDAEPLIERLETAHVIVVPSSYEGFGIVYLEGMAFGLPAIATTSGAASEIITHGENGFLIPQNDPAALAEHLAALAADSNLLQRMSLNALKRYRRQPTWDQTAGEIREFLFSLL